MKFFKCKHDWKITYASNVLQQDEMGYPLRLFITECSKCRKTDQKWYAVNKKCLDEIKTGQSVLLEWRKL